MFCKNCGSPVEENDMVCKNCGSLTEYGEKVSRHEAMPPTDANPAVNPDGTLKANDSASQPSQGVNLNDQFASGAGGYQPPESAQTPNNAYQQSGYQPGMQSGGYQPGQNPPPQGGYYYSPQNGGYRPPQESSASNGMAIAGFVCSFFIPLLGLIFSIIGLNRSKNMYGKGRGFAIAGIVISIVIWILNIVVLQSIMKDVANYYGMVFETFRIFTGA